MQTLCGPLFTICFAIISFCELNTLLSCLVKSLVGTLDFDKFIIIIVLYLTYPYYYHYYYKLTIRRFMPC